MSVFGYLPLNDPVARCVILPMSKMLEDNIAISIVADVIEPGYTESVRIHGARRTMNSAFEPPHGPVISTLVADVTGRIGG